MLREKKKRKKKEKKLKHAKRERIVNPPPSQTTICRSATAAGETPVYRRKKSSWASMFVLIATTHADEERKKNNRRWSEPFSPDIPYFFVFPSSKQDSLTYTHNFPQFPKSEIVHPAAAPPPSLPTLTLLPNRKKTPRAQKKKTKKPKILKGKGTTARRREW